MATSVETMQTKLADGVLGIIHGAQGWIQQSHVTWITTALAYGGTKLALDQRWIQGITAKEIAKAAAIFCSLYAFGQGIVRRGQNEGKDLFDLEKLPQKQKQCIIITNALALGLYAAPALTKQAFLPLALAYAVARAVDYFAKKAG